MSEASPTEPGRVWLVGTAHISPNSVEEVTRTIDDVQPDVVAVELDEARYRQLIGEQPEDIEPADLLQGNTIYQFLAYWLLSYVQMRLGKKFDITPGADMKAAIDAAETHGSALALVDRDIHTTIRRFWDRLSFFEKLKLVFHLLLGMLGIGREQTDIRLDELTDTDVVRAMIEELRRFSPGGAEALIDERDAFIAHKLLTLTESGDDVVAVVGAGHVDGIQQYLENPRDLPNLESLTTTPSGRRFSVAKIIGYIIAIAFISFFVLLAMAGVRNTTLLKLFIAWFLFNGIAAFSLAKLAGAHWSSATTGGLVAWLTSINPMLAPGWFAGYVELRYTHVNVSDISRLNEILTDDESPLRVLLQRMLDVPLFRVMAIVAMTNIGSFIATILFPIIIIPWLGTEIGSVGAIGEALMQGAENSVDVIANFVQ